MPTNFPGIDTLLDILLGSDTPARPRRAARPVTAHMNDTGRANYERAQRQRNYRRTRRPNERSLPERAVQAAEDVLMIDGVVPTLGRLLGTYDPTLRSDEDVAAGYGEGTRRARRAVDEDYHQRRAAQTARAEADPANSLGDYVADFGGAAAASIATDPTTYLAPGAGPVGRVAAQGAIGGLTDLALQGADVVEGREDDIDWGRAGINAGIGVATQGGGEVLRALRGRVARELPEVEAPEPTTDYSQYRVSPTAQTDEIIGDAPFHPWERRDAEGNVVEYGNVHTDGPVTRFTPDGRAVPVTREFGDQMRSRVAPPEAVNDGRIRALDDMEREPDARSETPAVDPAEQAEIDREWRWQQDLARAYPDRPRLFNNKEEFAAALRNSWQSPIEYPEGASIFVQRDDPKYPDYVFFDIRDADDTGVGFGSYNRSTGEIEVSDSRLAGVGANPVGQRRAVGNDLYPDLARALREERGINLPETPDRAGLQAGENHDTGGQMESQTPEGPDPNETGPLNEGGFTDPADESLERFREALRNAGVSRRQQNLLFAEERKRRWEQVYATRQGTSGEAGYRSELARLQGAMPRAPDFQGIRDQLSQEDVDALFDTVKNSNLTVTESITARNALTKILGKEGGIVPTDNELALLARVFPDDVIDGLSGKRPVGEQAYRLFSDILNLPRSLMATADLSAPLRQGFFLIGNKEFYPALGKMFHTFGSKEAMDALDAEIRARPNYELMEKAGLSLTSASHALEDREEAFMSTLAGRLPVIGHVVNASDRAYRGFLNKLRADVFDRLIADSKRLGVDFDANPRHLRDIATFVNAATGRGNMPQALERAAPVLNGLFFSPRLMASRLHLLNPVNYVRPGLNPAVRRHALKSLFSSAGIATTIIGLAALGGADVETDPRSTDFGKIRTGDTRFDVMGGFQPYIRLAAQLSTNSSKNARGRIEPLGGDGYKPTTRLDKVAQFFTNKESPIASFITDWLRGKDAIGNDFNLTDAVISRLVPMMAQDVYEAVEAYGPIGAAVAPLSGLGVGVQTYASPEALPPEIASEFDRLDISNDLVPGEINTKDFPIGELSETDRYNYQTLTDAYVSESLTEFMATDEYKQMSLQEQHEAVKELVAEAKKWAREDLFSETAESSEEEPGQAEPGEEAAQPVDDGEEFTFGIPTSMGRTPEHNQAVGGVPDSAHLDGNAIDFVPAEGVSFSELYDEAKSFFGPEATVLWEHKGTNREHVHVQLPNLGAPLYSNSGAE